MAKSEKLKVNSLCMLLFGLASLASFLPPLRAVVGEFLPSVVCCALVVLCIFLVRGADGLKLSFSGVISAAALVYIAFITILSGNLVLFNRYFSLVMFLAGYPIFRAVLVDAGENSKKILFAAIALLALSTCLRTSYALIEDPYLSRSIKSEGLYTRNLLLTGVGGYEVVYLAVLAAVAVLPNFFSANKRVRTASIVSFLVFATLVVLSNYMTALIILAIGCLLAVAYQISNSTQVGMLFWVVALFVVMVFVVSSLDTLIGLIASAGGRGRVSNVLLGSGDLLENISNEFFSDRAPVMQKSIDSFLQHPIVGQVAMTPVYGARGVISQAGQHSFLLDTFAYFGLVGGLPIVGAVFLELIELRRSYPASTIVPVGVALLILILFNNAAPSLASVIFVALPLFHELKADECAEAARCEEK